MHSAKKIAIYYNREFHDNSIKYVPNTNFNEYTAALLDLLLQELPNDFRSLTDIGAGAGKWTFLLSPYFKEIISIEPNDELRAILTKLLHRLDISNVTVINDCMPNCIKNISTDTVILIESIYLTNNWNDVYSALLDNSIIKTIVIADGPDTNIDVINSNMWHSTYNSDTTRLPLSIGDEYKMAKIAKSAGWQVDIFDIFNKIKLENNITVDRWLLIAKR